MLRSLPRNIWIGLGLLVVLILMLLASVALQRHVHGTLEGCVKRCQTAGFQCGKSVTMDFWGDEVKCYCATWQELKS